ncbi:MAG: cyclase family protein [Bacteroidetes bacterium]|nr:cyclase family protein [Bacteroidota bacterium]
MSGKNIFDVWGNPDWVRPIDLSWPLRFDGFNPRAFHIPSPSRTPLRSGSFVGSVAEGGSCNVFSLSLHPHGQGTHTECVGHISVEPYCINDCLRRFWFRALFCRIEPRKMSDDRVITRDDLEEIWNAWVGGHFGKHGVGPSDLGVEAIVLCADDRSLGKNSDYFPDFSGTNPPYFEAAALDFIREMGVSHLLTDLPSVDREDDGGLLSAHHAFWNYPQLPRLDASITELIRVPSDLEEGFYHLNLMIAPLQSDASPSKPILYPRLLDTKG